MDEKEMLKKMKEKFRSLETEEQREKFVKNAADKLDGMTIEEFERLTDAVEGDLKNMIT